MNRVGAVLAAALAACGAHADMPDLDVPSLAGGPRFAQPPLHVGDEYEYATHVALVPCQRWKIAKLDDGGRVLSTCRGFLSWLSVANDYNPLEVRDDQGEIYASFKPYYPQLKFPLDVGARWSGRYAGYTKSDGDWEGELSCEVTEWSHVRVPAGRFEAYRIQCVDRVHVGPIARELNVTLWYAPAVRAVVKSDNADDPRWDMELRRVNLQP
ncbi:MAG: hypothetical protein HY749_12320 [Gammaproteobacteria bacterium]|nr:hypothetical protein [Gammaproteobacteria bacterium]